jgi:hypothetical protein
MFEACAPLFPQADVTVLAAAVADYRPSRYAERKIKKKDEELDIPLTRTVDIAATLGAHKRPDQLLVGFALETDNETLAAEVSAEGTPVFDLDDGYVGVADLIVEAFLDPDALGGVSGGGAGAVPQARSAEDCLSTAPLPGDPPEGQTSGN